MAYSPPAFHPTPGAYWSRGRFHAWQSETTDGAIKRGAVRCRRRWTRARLLPAWNGKAEDEARQGAKAEPIQGREGIEPETRQGVKPEPSSLFEMENPGELPDHQECRNGRSSQREKSPNYPPPSGVVPEPGILYSLQVRMICYCAMQYAGEPTCSYEHFIAFLKEYNMRSVPLTHRSKQYV